MRKIKENKMALVTDKVKAALQSEYDTYAENTRLTQLANPKGIKKTVDGKEVFEAIPDAVSFDQWVKDQFTNELESQLQNLANHRLGNKYSVVAGTVSDALIGFYQGLTAEVK
jgi:hypothetical protein